MCGKQDDNMFNKDELQKYKYLIFVIIVLWITLFISFIFPINKFGILPRSIFGLIGIAASPFLHEGMIHLAANTTGLLILGFILINLEEKKLFFIIFCLILMSGFGTWLIGRSEYTHIGASGVIYGLIGYLIFYGIFKRNFKAIIASIIVFFLYGGALFGIFPSESYISWESHICGFISGVALAKINS